MNRRTMLFLLLGAAACADNPNDPPVVAGPSVARLVADCVKGVSINDSIALSIAAYDAQGSPLPRAAYTITVADSTIVRVISHGWTDTWVVGVRPGATTFTLTAADKTFCGHIVVGNSTFAPSSCGQVVPAVSRMSVRLDNDSATAQRYPAFRATLFDAQGNELTCRAVAWSVSDTSVLRPDEIEFAEQRLSGAVIQPGTVTITARSEGATGSIGMTWGHASSEGPFDDVGSLASDVWYERWMAARGMDDAGVVVGYSTPAGNPGYRPAISHNGRLQELEPLPGMRYDGHVGTANAINQRGIVAGLFASNDPSSSWSVTLWDSTGAVLSFTPLPTDSVGQFLVVRLNEQSTVLLGTDSRSDNQGRKGIVVSQGVVRWLGHLNDSVPLTDPFAINDAGQVVGRGAWTYVHSGGTMDDWERQPEWVAYHPFIWDNGVLRDLGVLGRTTQCTRTPRCASGAALDINDQGEVVGYAEDSSRLRRPVLWANGQMTDLGVFPGRNAVARAINNQGQIAGDGDDGAFVWDHGTTRRIGSLGGGDIEVMALNERGDVAGTALTPSGEQHAFAYVDGRMHDFGLVLSDACATKATAVNDRGDVLIVIQRRFGYGCQQRNDDPRLVDFGDVTHQRAMIWHNRGN